MQTEPPQPRRGFSPAGDDDSAWQASNCALARLLKRYRPLLGAAAARAAAVGRGIDALEPLMLALCRRTCRFCPEPCCIINTVWFDFQDLLFIHLQGMAVPSRQAATECGVACPFLGRRGCRLDFRGRPWTCIRYLCPAQRRVLARNGSRLLADTERKIVGIDRQREQMVSAVVRQVRRHRLAP